MKLHLKSIENQVLEKYLLPAEEIFEQSEVKELKLVDKNLWLSKIRAYEVEIQLLGNKVNAATCECAMFIQEGMCSHIVATLFAVRREKDKPKPRKKTRVRNTKSKKLTVSNILQNVNQEELLNFITAYARRDQQFTTALKARFAGAVQNVDLEEKYDQLLNTIIKSNQSANKTIQKPGAKKIHDIIEMLLNQAEEELIDNNYAEAFHITKNIIEKIHGILHQLNAHRNDITASLFRAFHQLSKLIAASIPPELNLQIVDFSISILQKRHFNIAKIEKAYYSFLLKICDHKDNFERILPSFDKELSRNFHNKDLESKVQLFRFGMLEKHGDPALFQSYFDSVKDRPWLLLRCIEFAHDWGISSPTFKLGELTLQEHEAHSISERVDEVMLQISIRLNDASNQKKYAIKRLLSSLDFNYFLQYKNCMKLNKTELKNLLKLIKSLPQKGKKWVLLGQIFESEALFEEMKNLIEENHSFDLFNKHAAFLMSKNPKETKALGWYVINHFLENHMGRPAAVKTRVFLRKIHLAGEPTLAHYILKQIRTHYSDRPSLMDEIILFR